MVNVILESDSKALNGVVIVSYRTLIRNEITSSVGSVKGETLANLVSSCFDMKLAGQVTDVLAITTRGVLGAQAKIRIRGTNLISSGGTHCM